MELKTHLAKGVQMLELISTVFTHFFVFPGHWDGVVKLEQLFVGIEVADIDVAMLECV
jgi:hypothetical protein